jgi:hypothetical protein
MQREICTPSRELGTFHRREIGTPVIIAKNRVDSLGQGWKKHSRRPQTKSGSVIFASRYSSLTLEYSLNCITSESNRQVSLARARLMGKFGREGTHRSRRILRRRGWMRGRRRVHARASRRDTRLHLESSKTTLTETAMTTKNYKGND